MREFLVEKTDCSDFIQTTRSSLFLKATDFQWTSKKKKLLIALSPLPSLQNRSFLQQSLMQDRLFLLAAILDARQSLFLQQFWHRKQLLHVRSIMKHHVVVLTFVSLSFSVCLRNVLLRGSVNFVRKTISNQEMREERSECLFAVVFYFSSSLLTQFFFLSSMHFADIELQGCCWREIYNCEAFLPHDQLHWLLKRSFVWSMINCM